MYKQWSYLYSQCVICKQSIKEEKKNTHLATAKKHLFYVFFHKNHRHGKKNIATFCVVASINVVEIKQHNDVDL